MKTLLLAVIATVGLATGQVASASEAMAKADGCLNCHNVDTKKMGPGFKETAAKYKGKADAQAMLVDKLKSGKGHPAVKASEDDLNALTKWILAM